MGKITYVSPVKLFIGIITNSVETFEKAKPMLTSKWGEIDFQSPVLPFDFTQYYQKEMGEHLLRFWVSFKNLISSQELAQIKLDTNSIEIDLANSGLRTINLDPGYLALSKIVLASTKDFSHRIYLSNGIYAEITMYYKNKDFVVLPWTYTDYSSKEGKECFFNIRKIYAPQLESIKPD